MEKDVKEFSTANEKLIQVDIEKEMRESFLQYSMAVLVSRALPDVRDGMKPVHRRIIYTMNEADNTSSKPYRKCAYTVGEVLGKYHPHGDASVYDALVRLAQDFSMRYPLIDGHGNFGSVDGDPPAAYRYTEARMAKIASELLKDIKKDTIDWGKNYDDKLDEPTVLPVKFPNLLVNGSVGIAVGMATNIPPHNLNEVCDAIVARMDNPECGIEEILQYIKGPDFPTGGIIMGYSGIRSAYYTGRGKITLRGKAEIVEEGNHSRIIVTEIPYMVNKSKLLETTGQLMRDKRIEGISNLRDESDKDGMRIVYELKRDVNAQVVLNKLYSFTQLQDTVGVIMIALVNGEPKQLTLLEILDNYIAFQKQIITRRTAFDLKKAKERAHILQGFLLAIDNIDEVISILRSSKSVQEGKERLMERFKEDDLAKLLQRAMGENYKDVHFEHEIGLSEEQADAIVQMRLGQLTGLERDKVISELAEIMEKINKYRYEVEIGEYNLSRLNGFDIVFRSPSVLPTREELVTAANKGAIITSEIEMVLKLAPCKIIGVTGTEGKTTTTSIIYEILKSSGKNCFLGGNIGKPIFTEIKNMKPEDIVVLELSSFQLMGMEVSPDISVVTNMYPDHLNIHSSYEEYQQAKKNIFLHQNENGVVILNYDNEITRKFADEVKSNLVYFSSLQKLKNGYVYDRKDETIKRYANGKSENILKKQEIKLRGIHNYENICAALAATASIVDEKSQIKAIKEFNGVEHRLEFVRELNGVKYYNDSIGTSPASTIAGLNAFDENIILLAGGSDKGLDYTEIGETIAKKVRVLLLTGPTAEKIENATKLAMNKAGKETVEIIHCKDLQEAVSTANEKAKSGEIVLMSPASASFDAFKNFIERGIKFKEFVNNL